MVNAHSNGGGGRQPGSGPSLPSSYQSRWRDHWLHTRHWVYVHWCWQPGHRPAVSKVFQECPQPSWPGDQRSGPQCQRLDDRGVHAQCGQRMRCSSPPVLPRDFVSLSTSPMPDRERVDFSCRGRGVRSGGGRCMAGGVRGSTALLEVLYTTVDCIERSSTWTRWLRRCDTAARLELLGSNRRPSAWESTRHRNFKHLERI